MIDIEKKSAVIWREENGFSMVLWCRQKLAQPDMEEDLNKMKQERCSGVQTEVKWKSSSFIG